MRSSSNLTQAMSSSYRRTSMMNRLFRDYDIKPDVVFTVGALVAFLAAFLIYPVLYSLREAFFADGKFTVEFFILLFRNPTILTCIVNSFKVAVVSTIVTMMISMPLTWVMVRYKFPMQNVLGVLLLMPLILPPFVGAIGMKQLLARYGALNSLLMSIGLMDRLHPIDWLAMGFWCIVIAQALHLYPIAYLNLAAALSSVDRTLEEAAQSLGADPMRRFLTVTLPLMFPGVFAACILTFIFAFTDLGTPLIFLYTQVIPVRIFSMVETATEDPTGYALIVLVLVITSVLFVTSKRLSERRQVAVVSVSGIVPKQLIGLKGCIVALIISALCLIAIVPHACVVLNSLAKSWAMSALPSEFTLQHYEALIRHPITTVSIRNSFVYSLASTSLDIILGVALAYVLTRRRIPFRGLLDIIAMMPLAIPGVVLAFGYVGCYAGTVLDPRINAAPLLIISYAVRRLPYSVRACYAGFQQVSTTLEEASMSLGASPLKTTVKVTLPLIYAHLVAGAILTFAFAMLEVSDSLILALNPSNFPMTKAIYVLSKRVGDGPRIASAMGVLGMVILAASLAAASKALGKRFGELFRA
ncbi:MAG: iron ABC transporter permease [Armatimonadota bacterium]|nr:iron ABC transporter permease [Armatimonadota bacterium]MCX7777443.1 iron ABC transporter permease [Armatimonadota bacterium]MDW8025112.1 iron ABC transporter permease [Armatimonadota bacterium]